MRTTIQLGERERETLLALASARGDKGVSKVVQEAVAFYLAEAKKPAALAVVPAPSGRWERLGMLIDRSWRDPVVLAAEMLKLVRARLQ
jgi:hypothetical protein